MPVFLEVAATVAAATLVEASVAVVIVLAAALVMVGVAAATLIGNRNRGVHYKV